MRVYRAWPGITERMASELHAHVWHIRPAPSLLTWLITVHDWGGDAGAAGIVIRREGEEKVLVSMRGRDGVGSTRES